jgi:hypothetical protein
MKSVAFAAIAALSVAAMPAYAATLYSNPLLSGPIATPGSISFTAASPIAQAGSLSFNLDGFASLDGVNAYEDDFLLSLNGSPLLNLSYNLGGGGMNVVFANPNGATITGGATGFFQGGQLQIALPVALLAGANAFTFAYSSPGPANGNGQGVGDEAWGVSNVLLTAQVGSAVPEPQSWALMIVGFGAVGGTMRYRRRRTTVSFA